MDCDLYRERLHALVAPVYAMTPGASLSPTYAKDLCQIYDDFWKEVYAEFGIDKPSTFVNRMRLIANVGADGYSYFDVAYQQFKRLVPLYKMYEAGLSVAEKTNDVSRKEEVNV